MEKYALVEREFQFGQGTNCKTTNTQWKNQNTPRNSFFLFIPCVFYTRGQKEQMKIRIIALILTEKKNEITWRYNYDIYYFKRAHVLRTETDIADRFATPTT